VKLILAEGRRRGMDGLEADENEGPNAGHAGANAGHADADVGDSGANANHAGANADKADEFSDAASEGAIPGGEEPPAGAANWLSEETSSSKVPPLVKVALYLAALGGIIFGAVKFIHRG
jgi:hypothetical protein